MAPDTRQHLLAILSALVGDAVERRAWRRDPQLQLEAWQLSVPPPPQELRTHVMGRSARLDRDSLLGREVAPSTRASLRAWSSTSTVDAGLLLTFLSARPMALVMLPEDLAEALCHDSRERGMTAMLGPHAFQPHPDGARAGFSDAASRTWSATAGSGGWRAVLVSPSPHHVIAGWLCQFFGWDAWLGILLGYPPCCATTFHARWRAAPGGDVSRSLLGSDEEQTVVSWTANAFVRVLGADLPLHFPCSADCAVTRTTVPRQLTALASVDKDRARRTSLLLRSAVAVARNGETVALTRWAPSGAGVEFEPSSLVASQAGGDLQQLLATRAQVSRADLAAVSAQLVIPVTHDAPDEGVLDEVLVVAGP